ncbi:CvpA family protein [Rhizosphaericola mali]|uniref:CvpA family protein n=1 Tax=Rhizosphaericola mali TaxID=2545455 RepID=A0A5P2G8A6_9BACT|nr:CvpA family protein [Rhizosphaericola mali]QES89990.1 CvpA family protein [Rhizosphaericola mali]
MIIDIITLLLIVMAIYKGWKKGLVVAICSFFALYLGLLIALRFSASVSAYFQSKGETAVWLPFIVFLLLIIVTIFMVRLIANTISKVMRAIMLGWLNRIGGILLYGLGYIAIFSMLLFYANGLHLISDNVKIHSYTFAAVCDLGPTSVHLFEKIIPIFGDMLSQLKNGFHK